MDEKWRDGASVGNFFKKFKELLKCSYQGFPDGPVVKNLPRDAGDTGSIPGPGRPHI